MTGWTREERECVVGLIDDATYLLVSLFFAMVPESSPVTLLSWRFNLERLSMYGDRFWFLPGSVSLNLALSFFDC